MPVVQRCAAIPRERIRMDYLDATIKVLAGSQDISRMTIIEGLGNAGVSIEDVCNIYRLESPSIWYVQFRDVERATDFMQYNQELYTNDYVYEIGLLNKQVVDLRIHWVPNFVHPDYIFELASEWGKVVNCKKDHDKDNRLTNIYLVKLEVSMSELKEIPHLLTFPDNKRFLVVMRGRAPLCLNCFETGHYSRECEVPRRRRYSTRPTYADTMSGNRQGAESAAYNTETDADSDTEEKTMDIADTVTAVPPVTPPVTSAVTENVSVTSPAVVATTVESAPSTQPSPTETSSSVDTPVTSSPLDSQESIPCGQTHFRSATQSSDTQSPSPLLGIDFEEPPPIPPARNTRAAVKTKRRAHGLDMDTTVTTKTTRIDSNVDIPDDPRSPNTRHLDEIYGYSPGTD